jgi:hypothetical protein
VQRLLQPVPLGAGKAGTQEAHCLTPPKHLREIGEPGDSILGKAPFDPGQIGCAECILDRLYQPLRTVPIHGQLPFHCRM